MKLSYFAENDADYLDQYENDIAAARIREVRDQRHPFRSAQMEHYQDFCGLLDMLPEDSLASTFDAQEAAVFFRPLNSVPSSFQNQVDELLHALKPWKKGPFNVWGNQIDAEWRSDWKWQRIVDALQLDLQGQKVADVGCGNGYFMFRMAAHDPELVVGFDPYVRYWMQFQLLNQMVTPRPPLYFELLGAEHLGFYPAFFNTLFCLGVLYHHTDPVGLLRELKSSLAPGGRLVIECQGIPGDEPYALCPKNRYARARGIWLLPTVTCLKHWIQRAGFREVECFFAEPLSPDEQRRTAWADIDSLIDFLDPEDHSKTIEGYPAPWRIYMSALK